MLEVVQGNKGFANVHEDEKGLQVEKSMKQVSIQGGAQIEICNFYFSGNPQLPAKILF